MRRVSCLIISLALLSAAPIANSAEPGFARGYAQALLDAYDSKLGLEARPTESQGGIEIAGEQCLPAQQQQEIAQTLTGAGPIVKVQWSLNCPAEQQPRAVAKANTGLIWLPTTDIFRALQADPREPELALGLQNYDTRGKHFVVGEVSAGETFSLVEGKYGDGTWQIGIQGAVFSIFDQDEDSNDLLNSDFLVALPLTYRQNAWSVRSRIYHISSHLGDEFILNNDLDDRLDISFEALDTIVSHEWEKLRVYGGGGYILRTTEGLEKGILQAGTEWRTNDIIGELDLSLAIDLKTLESLDWTVNQTYQAALIFSRNQREIRFLLEYYTGKSPNGQFIFNRLDYFGFGVQFGI